MIYCIQEFPTRKYVATTEEELWDFHLKTGFEVMRPDEYEADKRLFLPPILKHYGWMRGVQVRNDPKWIPQPPQSMSFDPLKVKRLIESDRMLKKVYRKHSKGENENDILRGIYNSLISTDQNWMNKYNQNSKP